MDNSSIESSAIMVQWQMFVELPGRILREKGGLVQTLIEPGNCWKYMVPLVAICVGGTALYGMTMGLSGGRRQILSSSLKMPSLLLFNLAICFPILVMVNLLLGTRLGTMETLLLMFWAMALFAILLVGAAPVSFFFGLSSGYHFMKLFHVGVIAFCGIYSMSVLYEGLRGICSHSGFYSHSALGVFRIWAIVYGFTGGQMAWLMRPFLGEPDLPFEVFRRRNRDMNFYTALWVSIREVIVGRRGDRTSTIPMQSQKEEASGVKEG